MSLDGALSIATSGLANVNRQMAVVSQNVANVNTPGYAAEIGTQSTATADGIGLGVRSGPALRDIDTMLQAELFSQNGTVAGLQTQQSALQAIDAVQGTPGQGNDIASLLGNLQNQFSTLLTSPDSQAQQSQVVTTAERLAQGINALSDAYTTQRQTAENNIVSEVSTLNTTLGTVGDLSDKIIQLKATGQSTADLENQRDAALTDLSQLVGIKVLQQSNGDVLVATGAGLVLPTHGTTNPFSVTGANVQPGAYYPGGGIQGVMLRGVDITSELQGGQIGANIALRDTTLQTYQAELDELSQNVASRFDAQGLDLFTDAAGNVPTGTPPPAQNGYVGFASTIQVNPAVQADPSLVRDGTAAAPTGLAGYTGVIQDVLTYGFGADQQSGAPWTSNTSGLGPTGTLNAPYTAPATIGGIAATLVASQAQDSSTTSSKADNEQAVQSALASKLSSHSGVNMDDEMSHMIQLQNSYGANAKIISTIQSMWTQLLQAVS